MIAGSLAARRWRPWHRAATTLLAVSALALAGCGQKGPLTLPKAAPAASAASAR